MKVNKSLIHSFEELVNEMKVKTLFSKIDLLAVYRKIELAENVQQMGRLIGV